MREMSPAKVVFRRTGYHFGGTVGRSLAFFEYGQKKN